ncbi:6-O-methylguanine DNA methyltransferase [Diplogelasinospora grovesii]|uniref:6-O-methylguanine DNA methyltransferase n=1 Tax=Diplogelasinospora grovesii TaxID=303347 RepID=A0AAN6N7S9_9PEZI|nr:6-O-methylguanine DNA methyltransferase [Diplogelasinospora grovesii]
MPRSDEASAFFYAVYSAVQEIPHGKVTSYGHIARLVGTPQRPRQVGVCLKHLPTDTSLQFNHTNVPWQRVINAKGVISPRSQPAGSQNQATALRAEGVEVLQGPLGELIVDLETYGWFPRRLPSEAANGEGSDDEDEELDEGHEDDGDRDGDLNQGEAEGSDEGTGEEQEEQPEQVETGRTGQRVGRGGRSGRRG